jgi:hypothetical protein
MSRKFQFELWSLFVALSLVAAALSLPMLLLFWAAFAATRAWAAEASLPNSLDR